MTFGLEREADLAGLCKGSTTDSDSVCEGSNPSPAAKQKASPFGDAFLFLVNLRRFEPSPMECTAGAGSQRPHNGL